MTNYYTENLADFGIHEIKLLHEILSAWLEHGLPNGFDNQGVRPAMNMNSGNVFLVNEDFEVAMMNADRLEVFYFLPYDGKEGFLSDLVAAYAPDDLDPDDVGFILDIAERTAYDLPPPWLDLKIDHILED